jgi:predicted dehydrogenase
VIKLIKKYNTAIVGFGKLGILYTCLSNVHDSTELKYIVEPNFILRFFLKKKLKNVEILKDIQDLKNKKIDIVFITTPNYSHFNIAKFFLENSKTNLFIEKPLTISLDESIELNKINKLYKTKIQVGYMFRYCKTYIKTKDIIDKKELGEIKSFSCSMFSSQVFKETKNWRFQKDKAGGGVLITQNSHLIDLMMWFFGMPESIYANTTKIFSNNVEDEVSANFEYKNFSGNLETSWSKKGYRNLTTNIEIHFEKGFIKVNEDQLEVQSDLHEELNCKINKVNTFNPIFFDLAGDYYSSQFSNFIETINNDIENFNNVNDSLKIHYIIEKIYNSSKKNKKVVLNENFS